MLYRWADGQAQAVSMTQRSTCELDDSRTLHHLLLLLEHVGVADVPVGLVLLVVTVRLVEAARSRTRERIGF